MPTPIPSSIARVSARDADAFAQWSGAVSIRGPHAFQVGLVVFVLVRLSRRNPRIPW
jgi:hypothetical protein